MSLALVSKELREHGVIVAAAIAISALALVGLLMQLTDLGGRFLALLRFTPTMGVLLAMVAGNRLFAREYAGKTQLFLETIPVSRLRVVLTKWALGCVVVVGTIVLAWYTNLWFIRRTEVMPIVEALPVLAVVVAFALSLWSFAAMAGVLGRYRYMVWLAAALGVLIATEIVGLPLSDLPLFRLLGRDVEMGIGSPPMSAFIAPIVIAVTCFAVAILLTTVGSGALPSALAQRMTAREKVFVLICIATTLVVVDLLEPQPDVPPYEIVDGEHVTVGRAQASVLVTSAVPTERAHALAETLASDLDELVRTFAIDAEPRVFIVPQSGWDRWYMQRASLRGTRGIVLKTAPDAPQDMLRALVVHSLVIDATLGRAQREDRHVLLDGLAAWWPARQDDATRTLQWLRAAAFPDRITEQHLTNWSTTSERLGDCMSQAVAFASLEALMDTVGRERAFDLLRELYVRPPDDVRVLLEASPEDRLSAVGLEWKTLAARIEAMLARRRVEHAAALSQRVPMSARVELQYSKAQGHSVLTHVDGPGSYWVLYQTLGPWTGEVGGHSRFDVTGASAVLPISPASGTRLLVAVEAEDEALGCPVRLTATRLEVQ